MKGFLYTWLALLVLLTGVLAMSLGTVWIGARIVKALPDDTNPFLIGGFYVLSVSAAWALVMSRPVPRWVMRLVDAHTQLTKR